LRAFRQSTTTGARFVSASATAPVEIPTRTSRLSTLAAPSVTRDAKLASAAGHQALIELT
jgi:hypothetical protein